MITLGNQWTNTFLPEVNRRAKTNVLDCCQCGKCVSTCPVSQFMDFPPRKIMQMVKLGLKQDAMMANSTWFCLTCSACSGRCPREIEIPSVMEAIRHMAIEENYINDSTKVKEIRKFHQIFLDMIRRYGRNYELRMMAEFNIRWPTLERLSRRPKRTGNPKKPFRQKARLTNGQSGSLCLFLRREHRRFCRCTSGS